MKAEGESALGRDDRRPAKADRMGAVADHGERKDYVVKRAKGRKGRCPAHELRAEGIRRELGDSVGDARVGAWKRARQKVGIDE